MDDDITPPMGVPLPEPDPPFDQDAGNNHTIELIYVALIAIFLIAFAFVLLFDWRHHI